MKKLITSSLVTAFILLAGCFLAYAQQETYTISGFFPLLSGDSWTWTNSLGNGSSVTQTVQEGTFTINGLPTKLLQSSDGSQVYLSNDSSGIRRHREFIPAGSSSLAQTVTYSPSFKHAEAQMEIGQSVISSGTASFEIPGYGVYPLSYSGTSTFEALESVTVPKGTFNAGRSQFSLTFTGYIGPTYINMTVNQTIWGVLNMGVVKQVVDSKTYDLTGTNFTPDPFSFNPKTNVPLQTMIVSNPITVSGISAPAMISVEGGEYSIDGGVYTSTTGTVSNGQTIAIRLTSSNTCGTPTIASLNIGGFISLFTATTATDLYAAFPSYGIWKYESSTWNQLNARDPVNIIASGSALYANFTGFGIWKYQAGAWNQLNVTDPAQMVVSDSFLYAAFPSYGIWKYESSTWNQLNARDPVSILASSSALYANFTGYGIWKYQTGVWSQLNVTDPAQMVVSDSILYAAFPSYGIWKYESNTWNQLNARDPVNIIASSSALYANFTGYGIWKYQTGTWSQLNVTDPAKMVATDSVLYAAFPGYGIWKYESGVWSQLNARDPVSIIASGSVLYANFTGYGVWKYQTGTWSQLNVTDPAKMVIGEN